MKSGGCILPNADPAHSRPEGQEWAERLPTTYHGASRPISLPPSAFPRTTHHSTTHRELLVLLTPAMWTPFLCCSALRRWPKMPLDVQGEALVASESGSECFGLGRQTHPGNRHADLGPSHPLLGRQMRIVTRLGGGVGANTIPGSAELEIDIRMLPE